jgi:hypothetical protein
MDRTCEKCKRTIGPKELAHGVYLGDVNWGVVCEKCFVPGRSYMNEHVPSYFVMREKDDTIQIENILEKFTTKVEKEKMVKLLTDVQIINLRNDE